MTFFILRTTVSGGVIEPRRAEGAEAPFAIVVEANPLTEGLDIPAPGGAARIVAWSGTPAAGLFERDPRSWLPPARRAFAELCDALRPRLEEAGATLLFRPCSRHVLADPTTCLSFLRERAGQPFGIVLDPIGFLEPDMLDRAEEHIDRAFEILGEAAAGVLVAGGAVDERAGRVVHTPIGAGVIPTELILDPLRRHCPAETPVILLDSPDLESRIALVEAAR